MFNCDSTVKRKSAICCGLVFVCLILLWAPCSFAKVTKGPVLLRVETGRAAVMWESDVEGTGVVEYGIGEKLTAKAFSEPFRVSYKHDNKKKTAFIHKLWMNDLNAGATYGYRIVSGDRRSQAFSFRTGEEGFKESVSVNDPFSMLPYTSSVEIWM